MRKSEKEDTVMDIKNEFRSELYIQLSEFFKEPVKEYAEDIASGRLLEFFKNALKNYSIDDKSLLDGLRINIDAFRILEEEYKKLFEGPLPPYVVPAESIYKRWSKDPDFKVSIAYEKGYLMGDPAIDMIKRYQNSGIVIPDKYSQLPDHIALELEYMSYLCLNEDINAQKEFVDTRLDWIDDMVREIRNCSGNSSFYYFAACLTSLLVKNDSRYLKSLLVASVIND